MSEKAPSSPSPAEQRAFYDEQFREQAEKRNRRAIPRLLRFFGAKDKTGVDMAEASAIKENEDFERRQTAEYGEWHKRLEVVLGHILEKKNSPEGKQRRIVLLIMGGGVQGAYGMGQLIALNKLGMGSESGIFKAVIGISAGSAAGASYMGGDKQSEIGATIFEEECTSPEFINFSRIHKIMDADFLAETVRSGPKAIDQDAIRRSPTEFYVVATHRDTGAELINAKTAKPDMVSALHASISIGILPFYGKQNMVNEKMYADGAFDPVPIQKILDTFQPTDILVLPNSSFEGADGFVLSKEMFAIGSAVPAIGSLGVAKKMLKNREEMRRFLEDVEQRTDVNIGFMWPQEAGLSAITQDPAAIKMAIHEATQDTLEEFKSVGLKES